MSDSTKVTTYAYDAMNRLVGVQTAGGGTVTYTYDALGRRVAKNNNGATTRYVLDGWNVRLELDASTSNLLAANTHAGLDRLLVRDQGGASLFLHTDGLNSTTALTDAQGQVVERYRYAAFGKVETLNADGTPKAGNAPVQPFTFTGREWEPESGLFFYRNRFYSAQMGRFINRDPIGERGGENLYAYVNNASINAIDPLGFQNWGIPAPGSQLMNEYQGQGQMMAGWVNAGQDPQRVPRPGDAAFRQQLDDQAKVGMVVLVGGAAVGTAGAAAELAPVASGLTDAVFSLGPPVTAAGTAAYGFLATRPHLINGAIEFVEGYSYPGPPNPNGPSIWGSFLSNISEIDSLLSHNAGNGKKQPEH